MAEVTQNPDGKKKGKQKKFDVHIDFTPMVDMNMLLITFFMLCTTLSKPQTMEISMPSNDKLTEAEQNKVKSSRAITFILDTLDKVSYYIGEPDYENYNSLIETSYSPSGVRAMLIGRNAAVVTKVNELKAQKLANKISQEQFEKQINEAKKDERSPVVIIKATDGASYRNMVDILDEMYICSIGQYAIVDITDGDKFLIENRLTNGGLTDKIDRSQLK